MHHHIRTCIPCLDGYGIGLELVMNILDGIASLVDDLHSECTVIITHDGRHHRDTEPFHPLLPRVGSQSVCKHDKFGIVICHISFLTSPEDEGRSQKESHVFNYTLHISSLYLLLSLGWMDEPGDSIS